MSDGVPKPEVAALAALKQHQSSILKGELTRRGWTQADLARAAMIGKDVVSRAVNGHHALQMRHLELVAEVLAIKPDVLSPPALRRPTAIAAGTITFSPLRGDRIHLRANLILDGNAARGIEKILRDRERS